MKDTFRRILFLKYISRELQIVQMSFVCLFNYWFQESYVFLIMIKAAHYFSVQNRINKGLLSVINLAVL